jgi:putative phosphoribosyl transferase
MAGSGRGGGRRRDRDDPLAPYRRVRKPIPPPERVIPDRRREGDEERAEREMREALTAMGPRASDRVFSNRSEAGAALASALGGSVPADAVVLGIPRGGVVVAAEVAARLGLPQDVVIPRKVGAPGNPELGLGAIAEGVRVLDERLIAVLGVSQDYVDAEVEAQEREIARRTTLYREGRSPIPIAGRTVVVVDDGVATGGTAVAALRWSRTAGATRVVFAAPVAPPDTVARLATEADEVVVLSAPSSFYAVGQWYLDFPQVGDAEVIDLLRRTGRPPTAG